MMRSDKHDLKERIRAAFDMNVEALRNYAVSRQRGERATQPQVLAINVQHEVRERNTPAGSFTFVMREFVNVPLSARWTGSELILPDLEEQVARHEIAIRRRLLARRN